MADKHSSKVHKNQLNKQTIVKKSFLLHTPNFCYLKTHWLKQRRGRRRKYLISSRSREEEEFERFMIFLFCVPCQTARNHKHFYIPLMSDKFEERWNCVWHWTLPDLLWLSKKERNNLGTRNQITSDWCSTFAVSFDKRASFTEKNYAKRWCEVCYRHILRVGASHKTIVPE